jgi:hypothetical protein
MSEESQKDGWTDEQWKAALARVRRRTFISNLWRWTVYTFVWIWSFVCGVAGAVVILELITGVKLRDVPDGLGYGLFNIISLVNGLFIWWFVTTNHRWDWFLGSEYDRKRYLERHGR